MKILLSTVTSSVKPYTQLGLYNLKAYIDKYSDSEEEIKVKIIIIRPQEFLPMSQKVSYLNQIDMAKYVGRLLREKADIIGFSCFVWNIKLILSAARKIKKANPKTIIVLGGPEVSQGSKELVKKIRYIDYIIKNDGEQAFYELVKCLANKKNPNFIKGVCYSIKNKIIDNPYLSPNLNFIPSPYTTNLIDLANKNTRAIIETTRGCPYKCAYCTYHLTNSRVNLFPLKKVTQEIKYILEKKVQKMGITDDNFNLNEGRACEILKAIIKHNKETKYIPIFLNAYVLSLTPKFIKLFKKAGAYGLIGVQTYNKKTLSNIRRYSQFSLLEKNLLLLKKNGIKFNLQFIIGLPGDDYEDMKASVDWAYLFLPDQIVMQELQVFPGTPLYKNADKLGLRFQKEPPYKIIETKTFSKKDMARARRLSYAAYIFSKRKYLYKTTELLVNQYKLKFSYICEEWLKFFRFIFNDNRQIYKQSQLFLNFLLKDQQKEVDWITLKKTIKDDVDYYLKFKDYYAFEAES